MKTIQTLSYFFSLVLMVSVVHGQEPGAAPQQAEGGAGPGMAVQDLQQQTEGVALEEEPLDFDSELPLPGDRDPDLTEAIAVGQSWLERVDRDQLGAAWNAAAAFFRERLDEGDWSQEVRSSRQPLGTLEERELESSAYYSELPPIVPDGEYAKLTFMSNFSEAEEVLEVVTLMRGADGTWVVAGYRIPE
ncbi:MAG: DUF4019 domain-containing protein [Opitutales bacterium]|nr:DUF4019 domain-containing protein [Opitutales bacterium]